jgi:hypothetical protein
MHDLRKTLRTSGPLTRADRPYPGTLVARYARSIAPARGRLTVTARSLAFTLPTTEGVNDPV